MPNNAPQAGGEPDGSELDLTDAVESVRRLLGALKAGELTAPAREVARLEGAYVALRAVADTLGKPTGANADPRQP